MIKKFVREFLKIENFEIIPYNLWKDNLTYEIILESWEKIVIQQMLLKKSDKNLEFIEKVIQYTKNDNQINFANKYFDERFIKFDGYLFQIMEKIDWKIITENDIDKKLIEKTAEYIAVFHNKIDNFNWKNFEDINYFKKVHSYRNQVKKLLEKDFDKKINEIFLKMDIIAKPLKENLSLPKWVIHGDPAFKNFLIDQNKNIVWLIDYDMLSVNNYIWDIADMIRWYMKIEKFQKNEFELLINSYNNIRKLTKEEKYELKSYCKMMILDTGFRYLLSCFEINENKNLLWDKNDSLKKANRCLLEIEKLDGFW